MRGRWRHLSYREGRGARAIPSGSLGGGDHRRAWSEPASVCAFESALGGMRGLPTHNDGPGRAAMTP